MSRESELKWKISTDDDNISLHDCLISKASVGKDIILFFDDGFDVTSKNICNETGRHKRTGTAAVILHNAIYEKGVKFLPENKEKEIAISEIFGIDFEVLDFYFDNETGIVEISGDAWDESVFCKLKFRAGKISYCWNEFVEDAWFQDWE